jgi:hypothetical protein
MARRFDISDKLIQFTGGGECVDDAFARLRAIIREGRLIASSRVIRGGFRCVSKLRSLHLLPPLSASFLYEILAVRIDVRKELDFRARWPTRDLPAR